MAVILFVTVVLLIYLAICTSYLSLFAIAGRIIKPIEISIKKEKPSYKILVLIPAYKEDNVIIEVARQALQQSYPQNLYEVAVICDSLKQETMMALRSLPITLLEVKFSNPTKAKAINSALQQFFGYDLTVVLDADNIMDFYFLEKVSQAFTEGYTVVQGHRIAKNTNTSIALLDAISEEINNHIFRKGHCALSLSSALIGSAMAFDFQFFKQTMAKITAVSGFDKELELAILKDRRYIYYAEDALVYDEKVQRIVDFKNQRTRWIAAQLNFLTNYFFTGIFQLVKGNVAYFDKLFQFMLPPRLILLGLTIGTTLLLALLQHIPLFIFSSALVLLLLVSLFLSIPNALLKKMSWREVFAIPILFIQFIFSVFQIRKARYTFIHTPHGQVKQK
jgi:cellulose synthase/poly-beta-1,6-N-acetylglucosamine synthase-like glycosyltransferase